MFTVGGLSGVALTDSGIDGVATDMSDNIDADTADFGVSRPKLAGTRCWL